MVTIILAVSMMVAIVPVVAFGLTTASTTAMITSFAGDITTFSLFFVPIAFGFGAAFWGLHMAVNWIRGFAK